MNITEESAQNERTIDLNSLTTLKETYKKYIEYAEMLDRLHNNKDFKSLFLEHYCEDFTIRLTNLLADPMLADKREDLVESLVSIAKFNNFMRLVYTEATTAEKELTNITEAEVEFYKTSSNN